MDTQNIVIAGGVLTGILMVGTASAGDWITFEEDTSNRLIADAEIGADDVAEKAYAWGDVDQDGDIDLVVARKEPFATTGQRHNVLLMNEGIDDGHAIDGVLVDRTTEYASASTVQGDEGFLTPTNDRDITLVDVNLDGWLDIVTAVTLSDDEPVHIKLPRVYINLGEENGQWQGFRYEADRVEDITPQSTPDAAPRFHTVDAGDLNGDGAPDLYFADGDAGGDSLFDFNNRVLMNDGNGNFTDETLTVLPVFAMRISGIWSTAVIADVNDDGLNDVVRQVVAPPFQGVTVTYNDPNNVGVMNAHEMIFPPSGAATYLSVGELNNDGLLDIVLATDFQDRVLLNEGVNNQNIAAFQEISLQNSQGFGGDPIVADLDNDGLNDIMITDVDEVVAGCEGETRFFRNQTEGASASFTVESAGLSPTERQGVHDAAVFDINGDGAPDIVFGRCFSTEIWIQDDVVICPADLDGSAQVNVGDLLTLLGNWGTAGDGADLAEPNNVVNVADLLALLGAWGPCE